MPQYTDYPAVVSLDGSEILAVVVDPTGAKMTKSATTQQIADLSGSGGGATTLNGSTAGHAYVTSRSVATDYKEYVIVLVAWQDSGATFNWPTGFTSVAVAVEDVFPVSTVTIAHIVFGNSVGAAVNGIITVKGR